MCSWAKTNSESQMDSDGLRTQPVGSDLWILAMVNSRLGTEIGLDVVQDVAHGEP